MDLTQQYRAILRFSLRAPVRPGLNRALFLDYRIWSKPVAGVCAASVRVFLCNDLLHGSVRPLSVLHRPQGLCGPSPLPRSTLSAKGWPANCTGFAAVDGQQRPYGANSPRGWSCLLDNRPAAKVTRTQRGVAADRRRANSHRRSLELGSTTIRALTGSCRGALCCKRVSELPQGRDQPAQGRIGTSTEKTAGHIARPRGKRVNIISSALLHMHASNPVQFLNWFAARSCQCTPVHF